MLTLFVLAFSGFGAGVLNAVAGGGTFLSFPALVWAGVPPIMANATATFAAMPGYIGSAWAYRDHISGNARADLSRFLAITVVGGFLGAVLLLITPQDLFSGVLPWLLLLATLAFALGPIVVRQLSRSGKSVTGPVALGLLLAVCIYGGYFNGGLGIMLLAAFGLIGMTDLHQMNGLKNLVSAVLSVVSVLTYTAAGLIDWPSLFIVGLSCALGGYVGALCAKRIRSVGLLRAFIVTVGVAMTVLFFLQNAG